jgi:DNA polymerase III epsilon subunit-like protein
VNHYDPEVWDREAKPFTVWQKWLDDEISSRFGPRGHVAIGFGHNAAFDRGIVDQYYYKPSRRFFPISYHCIDTATVGMMMKLAGVIDVPNVKLATLMEALGLGVQSHQAMGDCIGAMEVFKRGADLMRMGSGRVTFPRKPLDLLDEAPREQLSRVGRELGPLFAAPSGFPPVKLDPVRPQGSKGGSESFL